MQTVEVYVPDGVAAGDAFVVEYEGQQLTVECPHGCTAGDTINIEIDVPKSSTQQVEVVIPDGCVPGTDFTVEHAGSSFTITVPDGCAPGQALVVEVPEQVIASQSTEVAGSSAEERDAALTKQAEEQSPGTWACSACTFLNAEYRTACEICGTARMSDGAADPRERSVQEERDADLARRLQGDEVRESANASNAAAVPSWTQPRSQPSSLWNTSVGTDDGTFGKPCGDFYVGQLVQVTRSDGSWTYGKIIAYDEGGDNYSVMTKAGPKHFVERADLTDDTVINPSDGSCAQQ